MEVRLIVGYGVLLVLVLGCGALALSYCLDRRARYRARWRIGEGESLSPGWWHKR